MGATRLPNNPIIRPHMDDRMGDNINGPSLIRVPDWIADPLGAYYLYFADHRGDYIRLAYADALRGPWAIYSPGALRVEDSHFPTARDAFTLRTEREREAFHRGDLGPHIASPDVHVDNDALHLRMYFHGLLPDGSQQARVATSSNGLHFAAQPELLGPSYFRVLHRQDGAYALARDGRIYRSTDGLHDFIPGPQLFDPAVRHTAWLVRDDTAQIFYSRIGDEPERIRVSRVDLSGDWHDWSADAPDEVLAPEEEWEGVDLPLTASRIGYARHRVHELRDPAIYEEDGRAYLLYSVAGESGIAIAELEAEV